MKKQRLDTQLVMTFIALFFIMLSVCFINDQQPGYSQYLHHFDWYNELNEASRMEDRREGDDYDPLVLNPVSFRPFPYTERFHTSLREASGWVIKISGRNRPAKSLPNNSRKAIVRRWYRAALKTSTLPVAIVHFSASKNRIGGWKDTNTLYRALNGQPA